MTRPSARSRLLPPLDLLGLVMAGGAVGTAARYGIGQRFPHDAGGFPTTTLVENVVGAALLGALVATMLALGTANRWFRPLVATGVLGSFTTFSTFTTDAVLLVDDGRLLVALGYVAATLVLGLAAAAAGMTAARRWGPGRRRAGGQRPAAAGAAEAAEAGR